MSSGQDSVEIEFRAKVDELIAGLQQATAAMGNGFNAITDVVNKASQAIEKELGGALDSAKDGLGKLNEGNKETSSLLDEIAGKVNVAFAFGVVQKAAEFVQQLVAAVREAAAAASDVLDLSFAFGITSKELQGLKALAAETGTDFEAVNRVMLILQTRLTEAAQGSSEAAEALSTFGISAKDFNNPAFTSADALVKIAQSSTSAAEKLQLFGRNSVGVLGLMGPLADGIGSVGEAAEETGAATREQLEVLAEFGSFVNVLSVAFDNLKTKILSATVPALRATYDLFNELISRAGPIRELLGVAFQALGMVIKAAAVIIIAAVQAIRIVIDGLLGSLKLVLDAISGFGKALVQLFTGDFQGAWETGKQTVAEIGENFTKLSDLITGELDAAEASMQKFFGTIEDGKDAAAAPAADEKRPDRGTVRKRSKATDDTAENLKLEYDLARQGSEERIVLANQMVERLAKLYGIDSEQYRGALRLQMDAVRQYNEEQRKIAEQRVEQTRELALGEVEIREAQFQAEIDAGLASAEQIYAQQEQFANERLAIEESYYAKLKAIRADDALAQAQLEQERLLAQQERQKTAIENMNEQANKMRQRWEEILSPISTAFSGAIQGMIQGTLTLGNAVRKMASNVLLSFTDLAVKKTVKWLAGQIAMTQASAVGATTRAAIEDASAKKGILAGAFAALKKIAQFAATAAAGAFQAIVGIPYVGPFLAPAAAVAAGAAVLAIGRSIASASGGWEVDRDQLAMVHKDEMVLPARLSQGLRDLVFDKNAGSGGGGDMVFAPQVSAMDGASVQAFFRKNGRELVKTMFEEAQRFNPKMSPMMGSRGGV